MYISNGGWVAFHTVIEKFSLPFLQLEGRAGQWCDALHDFTAETQEDLSFKRGDHILILEHLDSEWYRGRLNGKEGIFPAVFVHVCSGSAEWNVKWEFLDLVLYKLLRFLEMYEVDSNMKGL